MITIHGVMLSPFVRKTLLAAAHKGIEVENIPTFPGSDDAAFRAISPLGKVPVLVVGAFSIPDSSVICRYLEHVAPAPSLYPADARDEARALWLEEFADSKLIEACAGLFQQRFLFPRMMGQATDETVVAEILESRLPPLLDYLESQTAGAAPLVGEHLSVADLSVHTCFLQARIGDYEVDAQRWPKLGAYLAHWWAEPLFAARMEAEQGFIANATAG